MTSSMSSGSISTARNRPSNLPSEQRRPANKIGQMLLSSMTELANLAIASNSKITFIFFTLGQSFPTPMEEPRKVLKAQYIGSLQVRRPSGMDTLNDAIDQIISQVPPDQWRDVNVAVAPSVVTITDLEVIASAFTAFPLSILTHIFFHSQGWWKDHRGIARPLSFLPRHRSGSGELRFHRPYGQRRFHCPCPMLPSFVWCNLQNDRGCLQGIFRWKSYLPLVTAN